MMGQLTATGIKALKKPGRHIDGDGLMLNVTPGGSKSWIFRIQHQGRRRDFGLGSAKNVSLSEARDEARRFRRIVRSGLDPIAERRKDQAQRITFKDAAQACHESLKAGWKNGKHNAQWMSTLKTYAFPKLAGLSPNEIDGPAIRDVLDPIWLEIPETARRVRQRIGAVLDYSYSRGWRETEAPIRSVSKGLPRQPKKKSRFAAMPYQEVPGFLRSLRETESAGRLALEALILTATRSGEVRGARWSELDLSKRLWHVPAERMKAGEPHTVPLPPRAIDVFKRAKRYRISGDDLVFPGNKRKQPLSDMTLLKILRDMSLPYTVHGFRSSFRDWAAERSEIEGEVAEAALAHSVPNKVEAAYRRTDYLDHRRELMKRWADYLTAS